MSWCIDNHHKATNTNILVNETYEGKYILPCVDILYLIELQNVEFGKPL